MRILVTGSSGLVGTTLCARLRARGDEITPYDLRRDHDGGLEDLGSAEALERVVRDVDGVIHLAAISRVAWGEARPDLCERTNVLGTRNLIAAVVKARKRPWLVFASSREVYGEATAFPVPEDAPIRPLNVYGRSKARGEALVQDAKDAGIATATVRLSSVYGSLLDHPDRAIPALLWRAIQCEELRITGAASRFDFVHVEDSVSGLIGAADRLEGDGQSLPTVHLATGVATSLQDLAQKCLAVAASDSVIVPAPRRPFDVGGFVGDTRRAREVLGWEAETDLSAGLARLHAAMRARNAPLSEVSIPDPDDLRLGKVH